MRLFFKHYLNIGSLAFGLTVIPVIAQGGVFHNMVHIGKFSSVESKEEISGFHIDRYEVTQKEYLKVMHANPSFFQGKEKPVEKVTWHQAFVFCKKIGKRLPTEQEWERAIRAGTTSPYYWGKSPPDSYAWHKGNANKQTHDVGGKAPNSLGLYDMAGNVWEWTQSDHERSGKVARGGSWRNGVGSLKSSHRISSLPIHKFHYIGFRCAY
jgi:formylglycine-generating enzyme